MREAVKEWLVQARGKLADEPLATADLDRLEAQLAKPRQRVLYLYSKSTNMRSSLASWALYDPDQPQIPTLPSAEAPYDSVLAALADGWRVVQFPIAKLYDYEGQDNDYLGFEFVLEKII